MENASEYEAPRMSIQTKDLIRYNNHITYYKKITQISSKNPTIIRQTDSRTPRFTSSDSRKFFRFSKLRKLRGGEAFVVAKGHFPSSRSSPPATQFAAGCGNVYVYRRGDGFYGIECGSLCRFLFALDEMRPAWQACFCCFLGPVLFVINFNQIK